MGWRILVFYPEPDNWWYWWGTIPFVL